MKPQMLPQKQFYSIPPQPVFTFRTNWSQAPPGWLLAFVLAFVNAFKDGKTGFFCVRNRECFGRVKGGPNFTDGLLANRALRQGCRRQWPTQGELASADFAVAFAEFVFVKGHSVFLNFERWVSNLKSVDQGWPGAVKRIPPFTAAGFAAQPSGSDIRIFAGLLGTG